MPFDDFDAWRRELLATGDLLQHVSVPEDEAVRGWNRYVALADMIDGTEGPRAVHALIASLVAEHDHGAHEAVYGAIELFPSRDLVSGTVLAAADLLNIPRDNSGTVILLLALLASDDDLREFAVACGRLEPELRAGLRALIAAHEATADDCVFDERAYGRLWIAEG